MEKGNKSVRSFDLEKGARRSFDLEKKSSKRFDLAKEDKPDVVTDSVSAIDSGLSADQKTVIKTNMGKKDVHSGGTAKGTPEITGNSRGSGHKKNGLLFAVAVVAVALIVGIISLFKGTDKDNNTMIPSTVEQEEQSVIGQQDEASSDNGANEKMQDITEKASVQQSSSQSTQVDGESSVNESKQTSQTKPEINDAPVSIPLASNIEEQAWQVIRGDFGNGEERKQKLGAAYDDIQKKVNELYNTGDWK